MKKSSLLLIAMIASVSGCVSNQAVQTVQAGDDNKSCSAIKSELAGLGAKFEDAKDDSGVTGKNVGLAIVFWPGILVNEVRSNKNQDSIDARISNLSALYNSKCLATEESRRASDTAVGKLRDLKELHEQGIINDEEYEVARKRAVDSL